MNNPEKETYELYNLVADPGEIANVLNQYPEKVRKLKKIMQQARTTNAVWNFGILP